MPTACWRPVSSSARSHIYEVRPLTSSEALAAYIGAAAWLPQIGAVIYRRVIRSRIRILPERQVELGYTTMGPILNIRVAFAAETKDAVLDHVSVLLRHEDGETKQLTWVGYSETFSEITDTSGNRQRVERDQPAIALKLSTVLLTEKLVRFHDTKHQAEQRASFSTVLAQYNYLKANDPEYRTKIIDTRQTFDLLELYKASFWWKPGKYTLTFDIKSPDRAKLRIGEFEFVLAQSDVDALRDNLARIPIYYRNLVMSDVEDYKQEPISWAWRNVYLRPL
jgi:hypothetical protein